jgi:hypothetical protein
MKKDVEHLTSMLSLFGLPKKYFIQTSDARLGKKVALATKTASSLSVHTDYMTPKEMECYLRGWHDKKVKRI